MAQSVSPTSTQVVISLGDVSDGAEPYMFIFEGYIYVYGNIVTIPQNLNLHLFTFQSESLCFLATKILLKMSAYSRMKI